MEKYPFMRFLGFDYEDVDNAGPECGKDDGSGGIKIEAGGDESLREGCIEDTSRDERPREPGGGESTREVIEEESGGDESLRGRSTGMPGGCENPREETGGGESTREGCIEETGGGIGLPEGAKEKSSGGESQQEVYKEGATGGTRPGRPRKFESPEQMQRAIDAYFESCDNAFVWVMTKSGPEKLPSPDPYTIEGLAVALDMTRQSLLNYGKLPRYEPFFETVSRAKLKVQANLVTGAVKGRFNATSVTFYLRNNFDYTEQKEATMTDKTFDVEF